MKENDKWPFYDHFQPFFDNYMTIFHKTEVQTVILRCLTGLSLIDSKVLIQNANISISIFCDFVEKNAFVFFAFFLCFFVFTPSIVEIICVKNVGAIVVCGFFMK